MRRWGRFKVLRRSALNTISKENTIRAQSNVGVKSKFLKSVGAFKL